MLGILRCKSQRGEDWLGDAWRCGAMQGVARQQLQTAALGSSLPSAALYGG
jgi:hypothetical protein